jgi:hypothetical protein
MRILKGLPIAPLGLYSREKKTYSHKALYKIFIKVLFLITKTKIIQDALQ